MYGFLNVKIEFYTLIVTHNTAFFDSYSVPQTSINVYIMSDLLVLEHDW